MSLPFLDTVLFLGTVFEQLRKGTMMKLQAAFVRDATRQGRSDGMTGSPRNPGDFEHEARAAYFRAYDAAEDQRLDRDSEEAHRAFGKVQTALPRDPLAHPMSGRTGGY